METPKRYRTKKETIQYFNLLAHEFSKAARTAEKDGDAAEAIRCYAKADAYEIAAFEIEHNADWTEAAKETR